jgi:diguanylate cyclase (GGDEF)-like protein
MLLSQVFRRPLLSTLVIAAAIVLIATGLSVVSYLWVGQTNPGVVYEALSAVAIATVLAPSFLYPWIRTASRLKAANFEISTLASTDTLTSLPNYMTLLDRMAELLGNLNRGGQFAVLFVGLDHFKQVNDTLGHPRGDAVLIAVGERLRKLLRSSDTVARFGGDEFVVLLAPLSTYGDASAAASKIVATLSAPYDVDAQEVVIGASIGIAIAPVDGIERHQLLRNADLALSRAKSQGKRTWRFFEPAMAAALQARRNLELELRTALTLGSFELYYQPIISLKSGRVTTCEALIRWRNANRGIVLPGEFITVAEQIGIITDIGSWALRQACTACSQWPTGIRVAVNLSSVQFMRGDLYQAVTDALAQANLAPDRLELEITESVLLQDFEMVRGTLDRLRQSGVHVALDDFGTGYSSLSYLKLLPLDKVKIDRSFMADLEDERSLTLLRGVAQLNAALGITVVVEGIETPEQLDAASSEKSIHEAQGYLLGPPMPGREIAERLQSTRALQIRRDTPNLDQQR